MIYSFDISIHALREEGDTSETESAKRFAGFQSTPSARRATSVTGFGKSAFTFQSTPSARRATLRTCRPAERTEISIHALREEGDNLLSGFMCQTTKFQSTPSARRATDRENEIETGYKFQSTPSARRATPQDNDENTVITISIHALREEGDVIGWPCCARSRISIHALREEGDGSMLCDFCRIVNFNPRPPRGGRPCPRPVTHKTVIFQSTPSARRATCPAALPQHHLPISIHALREEGDRESYRGHACAENFNPRPPRGGRLIFSLLGASARPFQSTPSARRATPERLYRVFDADIFQSTPSARRATRSQSVP